MVISTSNVIAIRCPKCSSLDFYLLSLFALGARKKQLKIQCECGCQLFAMGTKDFHQFWLQTKCLMCEIKHLTYLPRKRIWSSEIEVLSCDETGIEIAFIGPKAQVQAYIKNQDKSLREMAEDMGFGEYFESPEVMYEVLDYLYEIAESEKLYCECGNYQIDIDVFPEKLELKCDSCGCTATIFAESEQDIKLVRDATEIKLTKAGFNFKNSGKLKGRSKQNKK